MSYQAFVTKIALRPHPNADRLQLATVLGEQVVVGLGMTDNEWVVYFPENGKLSLDYCQENDLFPRFNETGDRINAGYIDPDNRRVRAQNFRGEKSYGLVMSSRQENELNKLLDIIETIAIILFVGG